MPNKKAKAFDSEVSLQDRMAEANAKGYLGTVPDEVPNAVYALPNPGEGEGAPEVEDDDDDNNP